MYNGQDLIGVITRQVDNTVTEKHLGLPIYFNFTPQIPKPKKKSNRINVHLWSDENTELERCNSFAYIVYE